MNKKYFSTETPEKKEILDAIAQAKTRKQVVAIDALCEPFSSVSVLGWQYGVARRWLPER